MKAIYLCELLMVLLVSMTACSSDDEKPGDDPQQGVAINSIKATSAIDLSARSGWLFRVGYSNPDCLYYDYRIEGNELHALANETNIYHFDKRWEEGHVLGMASRLVCYFQDKRYFRSTNIRSMSPEVPDIADQSTEQSLLIADRLEAIYTGAVKADISDLEFIHANALIEFEIEGINAGAEVSVSGRNILITPLKVKDGTYKAITDSPSSIYVKVGNDTGRIEVSTGSKSNIRYVVKAHWDAESKKLISDDIKQEEWI